MSLTRVLEKFQKKSTRELEQILEEKEKYNDFAIMAAVQLLRERNGPSAELNAIEMEVEARTGMHNIGHTLAEEREKEGNAAATVAALPRLYSKRVVIVFAILFSTLFATVLMMMNMKQAKNPEGSRAVLLFGIFYTIGTMVLFSLLPLNPNLALVFNFIGALLLTEFFWNKYIGKEQAYRKRSWVKPALISLLITVPLALMMLYGLGL